MPQSEQKQLYDLVKDTAELCRIFNVNNTPLSFDTKQDLFKNFNDNRLSAGSVQKISEALLAMQDSAGQIDNTKVTLKTIAKLLLSLERGKTLHGQNRALLSN